MKKKNEIKQVVILTGGQGTRLKSITKKIPKPMVKIGKKRFVEILFSYFSRYGIKEILLLCHHKSEKFISAYHNKIFFGIKIKCLVEKEKLDTGGALKNAKKYLDKFFILSNGDTFFDINLFDLIKNYKFKKSSVLLSLSSIIKSNSSTFFKYNGSNTASYSGLSIWSKEVLLKYKQKNFSLDKDVFPNLIRKKKIKFQLYKKKFYDIGSPKNLNDFKKTYQKLEYKPAAYLDRDGVINKDLSYVYKIKDFIWKKDVKKTIKLLNDNDYLVIVISNQSGIGRGYYKEKDVDKLHYWVNEQLRLIGARIDSFYYSPYFEKSKKYNKKKFEILRKPNNGMIMQSLRDWKIDKKRSFLVGDQNTDIKAGIKSKIRSYLYKKEDNIFNLINNIIKKKI